MSRFFSSKFSALTPYTPGEQPNKMKYVKLNTNESPFPPSDKALAYAAENTRRLNLYPDPNAVELTAKVAEMCGVSPEEVLLTNGSDEILNFAFMAFCDEATPAAFPNITYGFYPVFAQLNNIPYTEIPLREDFSIAVEDYLNLGKTIFIANPNAPTGKLLSVSDVEKIVAGNPDNVVVIDEAYIDFGGESCIPLIRKYDNLLVTQTFSKSRSMAGARLGFGVACPALIQDLNTIKYSTNPYNINSMTMATAIGTLDDAEYTQKNCRTIMENRDYTVAELQKRGFTVLPSAANFIFATTDKMDGGELYEKLKAQGILVRHFTKPEICQYNRITIGTREQMDIFLEKLDDVMEVK